MKEIRRWQNGQTLIEVLIALLIVTLVLTTVVSSVVLSIRSSQYSRNKSRGAFLAQEAIEWIRIQRLEFSWVDFLGYSSGSQGAPYCLNVLEPPFAVTGDCDQVNPIDGVFSRDLSLRQDSVTQVTATVVVSWNERALGNS